MDFNEYNKKNSLTNNQISELDKRFDNSWKKYGEKPSSSFEFLKKITFALSAILIFLLLVAFVRPTINVDVSKQSQIEASNIELRGYIVDKNYNQKNQILFKDCLNNQYIINVNDFSNYLKDSKSIKVNDTQIVIKGNLIKDGENYTVVELKGFEIKEEGNFCEVNK